MRTRNRRALGPADHGRVMSLEQCLRLRETPGYVYELIDGALVVSPSPKPRHDYWVEFVRAALQDYATKHPQRAYKLSERCDVVVPDRPGETRPQPDLAAYRDYPDPPPEDWKDVAPIVVVEVISARREKKDTIRNRHLYWSAKAIREYWIIDPSSDALAPTLIALKRQRDAQDWVEQVVPFGKSFKSTALPRFTLNLKRRKRK